jgi:hypothetical protein
MKAANSTTIDQSFKWDDVIDFTATRTASVDGKKFALIDPFGGGGGDVFASEVQAGGVVGVSFPSVATGSVNDLLSSFISRFLLLRDFLSIVRVSFVLRFSPLVLILTVFAKVGGASCFGIFKAAWLAFVANCVELLIKVRSQFLYATSRAYFAENWLFTGFHNRDIIARWGDVKQGEFGER